MRKLTYKEYKSLIEYDENGIIIDAEQYYVEKVGRENRSTVYLVLRRDETNQLFKIEYEVYEESYADLIGDYSEIPYEVLEREKVIKTYEKI